MAQHPLLPFLPNRPSIHRRIAPRTGHGSRLDANCVVVGRVAEPHPFRPLLLIATSNLAMRINPRGFLMVPWSGCGVQSHGRIAGGLIACPPSITTAYRPHNLPGQSRRPRGVADEDGEEEEEEEELSPRRS